MGRGGERICDLAEEAASADDPMAALATLSELRREVDELVRAHAGRALESGRSLADVARALDISRQAAHRRYRHLVPERSPERPRRLRANADAQAAVRVARERAVAAGVAPGSEHVLLGILSTDSDAARALHAEGVTYETALACTRAIDASDAADGGGSLRRILREAGLVAVARGQDGLGTAQLLLAALSDVDGRARRTLAALGVAPAPIRERLGC